MGGREPMETIDALLTARAHRDLNAAMACYETDATMVIEPGKVASGAAALRGFTEAAMKLPLEFGARQIVRSADTALHLCRWTLRVPDGSGGTKFIAGCTTDVLNKQHDGTWLLSIDNGWGTAIVENAAPS